MFELLDLLVGFGIALGAPAYLVLQVLVPLAAPRDHWRAAALLPLLFSVPIVVWCFYALSQDSNLWPLPFILFAPLGAVYLGIVLAAQNLGARHA